VGAGGLASPLLLYLAAAGIGTLGIIDNDAVELSNLSRQVLYQSQHQQSQKVVVAQQQLAALNPHIKIHVYPERFTSQNAEAMVSQYDIVADCTDNFISRYWINDVCFLLDKPFVFASIAQYEGQCTIFLGKSGPCYRCLFPCTAAFTPVANCSEGGVLGVLPGMLGVIQATEIIKFILQVGESLAGRLLWIDLSNMQFREIHYAADPACELCGRQRSEHLTYPPEVCFMNCEISPQELQRRLQNKENLFLLDVRTEEEHRSYNIGGILIPLAELPRRLQELNPDLEIITYCRSGGRSMQALELLKHAGFKSVQSLAGGIMAVQQANLDFNHV